MPTVQQYSFASDWDFKTSPSLPQPSGKIGTSSGSWTGANQLIISALDRNNLNATSAITSTTTGDQIKLELRNNPTATNSLWNVSSPPVLASDSNYYTIAVSNLSALGTPAAGNPFTVTFLTASVPFPPPESALYWVLSTTNITLLQTNADKLILQGFAPAGAISVTGATSLTYTQAFWRQNTVPNFIGRSRPT